MTILTQKSSPSTLRAFSLIELMVVISIVLIVATLATPSFGSLITKAQVESKANTIFDVFQLSRNMAISQGQYITLCPSVNGNQCSQKWQDGMMAFIDNNVDRELSPNDEVIHFLPSTTASTIHGNQQAFTYSPLGTLKGRMGSLITCPRSNTEATSIRLLISQMGRVRVKKNINDSSNSCRNRFNY